MADRFVVRLSEDHHHFLDALINRGRCSPTTLVRALILRKADVARSGVERFLWCQCAPLIVPRRALDPDAGSHQLHARRYDLAQFDQFQRRTDQSAQAGFVGHIGKTPDLTGHVGIKTQLAQRVRIQACEDGDTQD